MFKQQQVFLLNASTAISYFAFLPINKNKKTRIDL